MVDVLMDGELVDEEMDYIPFAKDHGPLNLAFTFHACVLIHDKINVSPASYSLGDKADQFSNTVQEPSIQTTLLVYLTESDNKIQYDPVGGSLLRMFDARIMVITLS